MRSISMVLGPSSFYVDFPRVSLLLEYEYVAGMQWAAGVRTSCRPDA